MNTILTEVCKHCKLNIFSFKTKCTEYVCTWCVVIFDVCYNNCYETLLKQNRCQQCDFYKAKISWKKNKRKLRYNKNKNLQQP